MVATKQLSELTLTLNMKYLLISRQSVLISRQSVVNLEHEPNLNKLYHRLIPSSPLTLSISRLKPTLFWANREFAIELCRVATDTDNLCY